MGDDSGAEEARGRREADGDAEQKGLDVLRSQLDGEETQWADSAPAREATAASLPVAATAVLEARRVGPGHAGHEYLCEWSDGRERGWVRRGADRNPKSLVPRTPFLG